MRRKRFNWGGGGGLVRTPLHSVRTGVKENVGMWVQCFEGLEFGWSGIWRSRRQEYGV